MDIYVLKNFLAITREKNITRAAESLHLSQSSLSKQMIDLENELGKQLLIRGKRKITLTEDGVFLRKRAEEIIKLMDNTEKELTSDNSIISGEISIGGTSNIQILEIATKFRKSYPSIQFNFFTADATDIIEKLDHGTLDFAILLQPVDTIKYEFISLENKSQWGLLMNKDSKLASKEYIEKEDLVNLPLIFHRRVGLQREISLWSKMEPEEMNIAATYNVVSGSPAPYIRSGLGYFLTSQNFYDFQQNSDICFRPLYPPLELQYAFVWKRYPIFNKASELFLKTIQETLL